MKDFGSMAMNVVVLHNHLTKFVFFTFIIITGATSKWFKITVGLMVERVTTSEKM